MDAGLYARRFRRQLMASRNPEILLAVEGPGGLVGYCAGRTGSGSAPAEVSTLYLVRSAQNLGVGRRLLGATARVLKSRGAEALRLWVLDGNDAARGFYDHLGATPVARRPVPGWGGAYFETAMFWPDIGRLIGP
jgi:ribosomal protein S18 acetylase RimI-like enzyme